jgi:SAM-dependent methyltransferase
MSSFGEFCLRSLVRFRGAKSGTTPNTGDTFEDYFSWQYDGSALKFSLYPGFEPKGKTVLEIGCGTGGRTAYLASMGTARLVGIDINANEIKIARELCAKLKPHLADKVEYLVCKEAELLDIGLFDYVLLVDSMEHVVSPPGILRIAHQYLRPGGSCYFNTVGWYHPAGSHVQSSLIPWVNVLFSDETIINVIRWQISRPEYVPTRFDSNPPVERWRGIYNLRDRPGEHLNKITIREIKKLVKYSVFDGGEITLLPYQRKNQIFRLFSAFRHVPVIQEMIHSGIVVRLDKAGLDRTGDSH